MRSLTATFLLITALALSSTAQAQDAGLKGLFHRAKSAISHTASSLLGGHRNTQGKVAGPSTTDGPYYRPINPAKPGAIVGIFNRHRVGQAWPRVAVKFTKAGTNLACWTAEAEIWKSARHHHRETFQICNAPLAFQDASGQTRYLGAPEDDPYDSQGTPAITLAQNIQGLSHAQTALGGERTFGPNPPHMLFDVNGASSSPDFQHQYHEILVRLMWLTGWMDHGDPRLNNMAGKTLWVVGFDGPVR